MIVAMGIGVFLGMIAESFAKTQWSISGNVDAAFALLYGIAGLTATFGMVALMLKDAARRGVAVGLASAGAVIFVVAGFAVGMGKTKGGFSYSTDEIALLATNAEAHGQFGLAIERLQELEGRLEGTEARSAIQKRVLKLENRQGMVEGAQK